MLAAKDQGGLTARLLKAGINRYLGDITANPKYSSGPPIPTTSSRN
jgi:hypothetical protein